MRRTGRMLSTTISAKVMIGAGIFALIYIVVSLIAISRVFNLYQENRSLHQRLTQASKNIEEYRYQSQVLSHYQQLVNELSKTDQPKNEIFGMKPSAVKPAETKNIESKPPEMKSADSKATDTKTVDTKPGEPKSPEPKKDELPSESPKPDESKKPDLTGGQPTPPESTKIIEAGTPAGPPKPAAKPAIVTVVDAGRLTLKADGQSTIRFQFNLTNIHPDSKTISGYLFLILTRNTGEPPIFASYPEVKLKDGEPINYKSGTSFNIKHGKTFRGRIDNLIKAAEFNKAWILAYSEEGELILKKFLSSEDG